MRRRVWILIASFGLAVLMVGGTVAVSGSRPKKDSCCNHDQKASADHAPQAPAQGADQVEASKLPPGHPDLSSLPPADPVLSAKAGMECPYMKEKGESSAGKSSTGGDL